MYALWTVLRYHWKNCFKFVEPSEVWWRSEEIFHKKSPKMRIIIVREDLLGVEEDEEEEDEREDKFDVADECE